MLVAQQFQSNQEVIAIGEGLLNRTLPKEQWTHEAHFASVVYFLTYKQDLDLETELPQIISSYNEATGGKNTETSGYHETLTQFYLRLIKSYLAQANAPGFELFQICNALVSSPLADREFPLKYFSRETLFSVEARKTWVDPDLVKLDDGEILQG